MARANRPPVHMVALGVAILATAVLADGSMLRHNVHGVAETVSTGDFAGLSEAPEEHYSLKSDALTTSAVPPTASLPDLTPLIFYSPKPSALRGTSGGVHSSETPDYLKVEAEEGLKSQQTTEVTSMSTSTTSSQSTATQKSQSQSTSMSSLALKAALAATQSMQMESQYTASATATSASTQTSGEGTKEENPWESKSPAFIDMVKKWKEFRKKYEKQYEKEEKDYEKRAKKFDDRKEKCDSENSKWDKEREGDYKKRISKFESKNKPDCTWDKPGYNKNELQTSIQAPIPVKGKWPP